MTTALTASGATVLYAPARPGRDRAGRRRRRSSPGSATTTPPTARDGVDDVVELDGALVTPAFVDAHVHTTSTGLALHRARPAPARVSLADVPATRSAAHAGPAAAASCSATAGTRPAGRSAAPPTRHELDRASYGGVGLPVPRRRPLRRRVLRAARRGARGAHAPAGFADGGQLTRDAHHAVRAAPPATSVTPDQRRAAQRATLRARPPRWASACVHELAGPDIVRRGRPRATCSRWPAPSPAPRCVGYWGELGAPVGRGPRAGRASAPAGDLFADGAIGSHTAALRAAVRRRRRHRGAPVPRPPTQVARPRASPAPGRAAGRLPRDRRRRASTRWPPASRGGRARSAPTPSARPGTGSSTSRWSTPAAIATLRRARRGGQRAAGLRRALGRRPTACTPSGSARERAARAQPVRRAGRRRRRRWPSARTPRSPRSTRGRPCAPPSHHRTPAQRPAARRRVRRAHPRRLARGRPRRRRRRWPPARRPTSRSGTRPSPACPTSIAGRSRCRPALRTVVAGDGLRRDDATRRGRTDREPHAAPRKLGLDPRSSRSARALAAQAGRAGRRAGPHPHHRLGRAGRAAAGRPRRRRPRDGESRGSTAWSTPSATQVGLEHGVALPVWHALLTGGHADLTELAAEGRGRGGARSALPDGPRRRTRGRGPPRAQVAARASRTIDRQPPRAGAAGQRARRPAATPWIYLIVATGDIYEDIPQAQAAAREGADVVAVIRSTGQSLLDYVPEGATREGYAGTYATQENFRLMRAALDDVSRGARPLRPADQLRVRAVHAGDRRRWPASSGWT